MGLVDLADEELVIGQKLLLVDDGLIQEHTCNDTSGLISIDGLDGGIDTVSYEVLFLFSVNLIEAWEVNLRQLKELLLLLLLLHLLNVLLRHWILVASILTTLAIHRSSLGTSLFVIAILLLIGGIALILLLKLTLVSLVLALRVATSALASTTASISTSTSVVILFSLVTFAHHLGWGTLIPLCWLISLYLVLCLVLAHYVVDELFQPSCVFLFSLLFQVHLWLPEVYLKCFLRVSEAVWLIKHLNASLSGLHILIKDVPDFVVRESFSVNFLLMILHFHGSNSSCLWEFCLKLFFSNISWNESNENVWLESFFLILDNWVLASWSQIIFSSLDVLRD